MRKIQKSLMITLGAISVIGILIGAYLAMRREPQIPQETTLPQSGNMEQRDTFGDLFNTFILGRSGDGSAIGGNTPLVPAKNFVAGEKIGLRVLTSSAVTDALPIELRFLKDDTGEEAPKLLQNRKNISVKPGLKTYCCITMPKDPGAYKLGILVNNAYVGMIGAINVVAARDESSGSLLGL